MPFSYGGKFRSVQIDLDPQAMQARGLSATDVQNAFANQNQIIPAGNIKIGSFQYVVKLNNAADTIEEHERPAGQDGRTAAPSSCATSAMCATATPPQKQYRACGRRAAPCCPPC